VGQGAISVGPALAMVLIGLVAVGAGAAVIGHLGVSRAVVTASLRAVLQLGIVSLLITAVLRSWWATATFIAVMLGVAAATSARRITTLRLGWPVAAPIAAGALPVGAGIVAAHTMPLTTVAVLPIAGILIGGAMTATSLAGRRALDTMRIRFGEVEAALALGFTDREAVLLVCRPSAADALLPALDQTRTVGLVTLPGAFVGVLLGGASPVEASAAQLLVLVGLLAVEAVAVVLTIELIAWRLIPWPSREPSAPTRATRRRRPPARWVRWSS
jgi:putative ABC transport system permease protein